MNITFIGSGYVGLVSGAGMSYLGHHVTCLDIDKQKIKKLQKLEVPIFEDGLAEYIKQYGNSERLNFKPGYDTSLSASSAIFITVGTPERSDGDADLKYIFDAVLNAAIYANPDCIFIIKSTVPPGTCSKIKVFLEEKGFNYDVVSNPEFLREGSAIHDFMHPDRIVIGANSEKAFQIMRQIYKPFTDQGTPLLETDLNTSELIKYASNSFLAGKIAFINEMADLCEVIGADINTLSKGMGLDHRIGSDFLKAGPGFGGSCFPKDILALQHLTKKLDSDFLILDAIIKANTNRSSLMAAKVKKFFRGKIRGKKITVLGLTYKAGTDDLRNSPAIDLINSLWEDGVEIVAYDPQGAKNADKYFNNKLLCARSALEAVNGADALVIATEWPEFANLDYEKIKTLLNQPIIIDLRNILDEKELIRLGYKYSFVGQKTV